jgi:hypothetical protein
MTSWTASGNILLISNVKQILLQNSVRGALILFTLLLVITNRHNHLEREQDRKGILPYFSIDWMSHYCLVHNEHIACVQREFEQQSQLGASKYFHARMILVTENL